MDELTQHEKLTERGAILNGILSGLVALLLVVIAFFARDSFDRINDELAALQLDVRQLRAEMNALELGLRGDRFTRSDWIRERQSLLDEIQKIEDDVRSLRERVNP